jgi:hypothetical protein
VRYTGKPVRMPIRAHATQTGVEVDFTTELEAASATDPGNFAVELWNYHYSGNYGSPEVSVLDPKVEKHDSLEVKSVKLSADKKKLFIEVAGLQPADQFSIRYNVKAADGTELKSELIGTIHKLGTETAANLQESTAHLELRIRPVVTGWARMIFPGLLSVALISSNWNRASATSGWV